MSFKRGALSKEDPASKKKKEKKEERFNPKNSQDTRMTNRFSVPDTRHFKRLVRVFQMIPRTTQIISEVLVFQLLSVDPYC